LRAALRQELRKYYPFSVAFTEIPQRELRENVFSSSTTPNLSTFTVAFAEIPERELRA
jgi:hypothetical protein